MPSQRVDYRMRQDRTEHQTEGWHEQMDRLVDAYLDFRAREGFNGLQGMDDMGPTDSLESSAPLVIKVVDIFCKFPSCIKSPLPLTQRMYMTY
jgi:hypothetical protein